MLYPEIALQLERLENVLAGTAIDRLEAGRAARNLDAIVDRIARHDYRIASYADNKFNVPERIRDFFKELEFHSALGRTWQKVFAGVKPDRNSALLDLCPGAFPKVELGLHYSGFKGQVNILDLDAAALKKAREFLALFDAQFSLRLIKADAMRYSARQFDLVVANHMLDDLVMNHVCQARALKLDEVYAREKNLLGVWEFALSNRRRVEDAIVPALTAALRRLTKTAGTTILTQYPSYMERQLKLKEVTAFNAALLDRVGRELCAQGFRDVSAGTLKHLKAFKGIFSAKECRVLKKAG